MTPNRKKSDQSLRNKTKDLISDFDNEAQLTQMESTTLIHEIRAHQTELEIQNEELRKAQDDLMASHQRLADLFHRAPVGYLVLDGAGLVQDVNQTLCQMIGQPASKIKDRYVFDLIVEGDRSWFRARYKALFKKLHHKNLELEMLTDKASPLPVSITAAQYTVVGNNDIEDDLLLLLNISDISERKQAEQALQGQTDLLATVFESSPNILMLVNSQVRVEMVNRVGSEFAGSPQEELVGLLEFGDDGVGLPEHIDFHTTHSLGLQLIHLLTTHDLHGSVTQVREEGTTYLIEFPMPALT